MELPPPMCVCVCVCQNYFKPAIFGSLHAVHCPVCGVNMDFFFSPPAAIFTCQNFVRVPRSYTPELTIYGVVTSRLLNFSSKFFICLLVQVKAQWDFFFAPEQSYAVSISQARFELWPSAVFKKGRRGDECAVTAL